MTTPDAGAPVTGGPVPSPFPNPGPSVRVDRIGTTYGHFRVTSSPHPLHYATVIRSVVGNDWLVIVETAQVKTRRFPLGEGKLPEALAHAGAIIGALYRVDMRSRFTGPQRYAMGRNLCPARMACLLGTECPKSFDTGHYHLCQAVPSDARTVWCDEHSPNGPDMPGDAFRRLDELGGE